MKDILHSLGIDITFSAAGFLGSAIMFYNKKKKTLGGAFIAFTSGILCANYVTPVITASLGLEGEKMERGMAFILGFIGLQGVEYLINKYFPVKKDA